MTLQDVLQYCRTATPEDLELISATVRDIRSRRNSLSLHAVTPGSQVSFMHDGAYYTVIVQRINRRTATVEVQSISGRTRNKFHAGSVLRVGASLLTQPGSVINRPTYQTEATNGAMQLL